MTNYNDDYACAKSCLRLWQDLFRIKRFLEHTLQFRVRMEEAEYCAGCLRCGDERDAMFWCAHCSEFVCNSCAKLHKKFQTPHAVLAKEQLSISSELLRLGRNCEIHRLQKIVFFCCQHDQLACDKCKSESHQTCTSIVSIEEAAENVRNGTVLSDLERRIDNLSQRIGGILKYNKNLIGHDEYDKTEIKNKVRDVKQQLVLHFEELQNQLFNDIDKMFPRSDRKLFSLLCENLTRKLPLSITRYSLPFQL
ncbi:unnamed protein product [Mytilus coruscus]|uniref:B box-type domain-containing protein n=1 Tax=Mytilus coruscus TaxID=42192 RepID=A0A6J8EAG1_MYTCO|nr:unnamed protein product [Mytilus coruscus]